MVLDSFVFSIMFWIIGLVIFYLVISYAVKDGINKSVVGQLIEKKYEIENDKRSFLDSDLDHDK
ncbi:hypothetical protein [Bacillus testis]|uniref:hypothetical protein n=1 Tax=Bacillus testis TaxID=1622072 RepID=UPI00067E7375|nr:hypothetical protein [Bacillus testis]